MDNSSEQTASNGKVVDLSSSALESADSADMEVVLNGVPSGWVWTFAGPGHPKAIEQSNRLSKERLQRDREIEQARANGKKWKALAETPDEIMEKNARFVAERLIRWNPVRLDGQDLRFSEEKAVELLKDPRKANLLQQAIDFLADDKSFMQRSATTS